MLYIENKMFNEIQLGDSASLKRTLTLKDIELFAIMSGDVNPSHVDVEFAKEDMFHKIVAHGMWGVSLISTVLGTELPGPGTVYLEQSTKFLHPVTVGDTITVTVTVKEKKDQHAIVILDCKCINQDGQIVIEALATVMAPTEKIKRERVELPKIIFKNSHNKFCKQCKNKLMGFACRIKKKWFTKR